MWHEAKNSFKEMLRKPGRLILYLLYAALPVWVLVFSITSQPATSQATPVYML